MNHEFMSISEVFWNENNAAEFIRVSKSQPEYAGHLECRKANGSVLVTIYVER
jgi:hypothetical protein